MSYQRTHGSGTIQNSQWALPQRTTNVEVIGSYPHIIGNPFSKTTLVEFGDFQCPPCGFAAHLLKTILPNKTSHWRFEFREFPLTQLHPLAFHAAIATEAASEQGKFWQMHDLMYNNQNLLSTEHLYDYTKQLGFNMRQFKKSMEGEARKRVILDMAAAKQLQLPGTPSFILCKAGSKPEPISIAEVYKEFK